MLLTADGQPTVGGPMVDSMPPVSTSLMAFLREPAARKYLQEYITKREHLLTLQVMILLIDCVILYLII